MGTTSLGIAFPDDSSPIANLQDHLEQLARTADAAMGGGDWQDVVFENGWVNFDVRTVQYRIKGNEVWLRGIARDGTVGGVPAFTLPPGFRPPARLSHDLYFPVVSNNAFGVVSVKGDGTVYVDVGSNTWVSFDSVRFLTT